MRNARKIFPESNSMFLNDTFFYKFSRMEQFTCIFGVFTAIYMKRIILYIILLSMLIDKNIYCIRALSLFHDIKPHVV